ncbi:SP1 [Symbiodinium natans]|uniref:SP1 protein n=1 Tax=Symbiodinium natans TaxID=878477 RepID=A0A812KVW5_9DINO|nr:SP1 [Symbiodinium natans]
MLDHFCHEPEDRKLLLQHSLAELQAARSDLEVLQTTADRTAQELRSFRGQLQELQELHKRYEQSQLACAAIEELPAEECSEAMDVEAREAAQTAGQACEVEARRDLAETREHEASELVVADVTEPFPDWTALSKSLCAVCLEPNADRVAVPCGHQCVCEGCLVNLSACPVCRHSVDRFLKVFVAYPVQFEKECVELQSQMQAESRLRDELSESLAHEEARNQELLKLATESAVAKMGKSLACTTTLRPQDFQQVAKATRRNRELDKLLWPQTTRTARCQGEILSNQTMVDFQRHLATLPRPVLRR